MPSVAELTEDEKRLAMQLTQSPDEATAQIAAVREYLRYMKRIELLAAAGTIDFDISRVPGAEAENWPSENE